MESALDAPETHRQKFMDMAKRLRYENAGRGLYHLPGAQKSTPGEPRASQNPCKCFLLIVMPGGRPSMKKFVITGTAYSYKYAIRRLSVPADGHGSL